MKPAFYYIDNITVELDADRVLSGQGVEPARASSRLREAAQEILAETAGLIKPRVVYDIFPVSGFEHRRISFAGGSFDGALVARAFAGATELSIALCTIGPALDQKVAALMESGETFKAITLDGAGVAAIGAVSAAAAEKMVAAARARGLQTGMKASPGQEEWPLEQQRTVFELLPAADLGVRLTDSCLMLPRKSVTFAIGIGPEMREDALPCDFCTKRERCQWRHKPDSNCPGSDA